MKKDKSNRAGQALKYLVYIFLFLVSLAIYVGAGIIVFGWDWTLLYDLGFWVRSILLSIANLIIGVTVLSFVYDLLELKEKEYNEIETAIKSEAVKLVGHELTKDLAKINWHNKKQAWVSKKEVELQNHISRLKHKTAMEIELNEDPKLLSRKAKKYLRRKEQLEEQLTNEWISLWLHYQNINYEEITQTEVIYGIKVYKSKKSLLDRGILRKAIFGKLGSGLLFGILSTLGAFLVPQGYLGYTTFLIMLGINLMVVLSNIGFSIFKGFNSHGRRLNNSVMRFEILKNHRAGYYKTYEEVPLKKFDRKLLEEVKEKEDKSLRIDEIVNKEEEIIREESSLNSPLIPSDNQS